MFHVGQKVVCVYVHGISPNATDGWHPKCDIPSVGSVYTVRDVGVICRGVVGLRLNELVWRGLIRGNFTEDCFYWGDRFRPVIERSTDTGMAILREILNRAPVKENALTSAHGDS